MAISGSLSRPQARAVVTQTNFENDEAVGYLADRLALLGVETELRKAGARAGDEVHIGKGSRAVIFIGTHRFCRCEASTNAPGVGAAATYA